MKGTRLESAEALAKALLLGQSRRFGRNAAQSDVSSLDFQTCRSRPPGKSAGREAAPEAGLEIYAAALQRRDRTL
jgi:hypothetical protein